MIDIHKLLDNLHLEDLRNESHPAVFDENDGYDMLILKLPIIHKKLQTLSVGFIITPNESYMYNRQKDAFEKLDSRFEAPYKILDAMIDELLKSFESYLDLIVDMEEALYLDKAKKSFMNQWLELKRNIIKIEKLLIHSSSTMDRAIEHYKKSQNFPINHYLDLHEHLERTLRSASLQLSKLDYIYKFYTTQTNERINRSIFALTIISAIFLPLNLVVGFFGMNTSGLPFSDGFSGTNSVLMLMASLSIITIVAIYFMKRKI